MCGMSSASEHVQQPSMWVLRKPSRDGQLAWEDSPKPPPHAAAPLAQFLPTFAAKPGHAPTLTEHPAPHSPKTPGPLHVLCLH